MQARGLEPDAIFTDRLQLMHMSTRVILQSLLSHTAMIGPNWHYDSATIIIKYKPASKDFALIPWCFFKGLGFFFMPVKLQRIRSPSEECMNKAQGGGYIKVIF